MNQRIKDAWDKAAQDHSGDSWEEQTAFLEKFAELIVGECCVALNPMLRDMISRGQGVDAIKQHFGVE